MKKLLLILGFLFAGTAQAQSSVSGNLGANVAFAGPNPYYDLTRYGLYAGAGAPITCSITSGTNTLRCGRGIGDFAVGQGIEIPLAGPASTFEAWGKTAIDSYSRSGNVATYHVKNVIVGPPQTITISGLADRSFNGTFTITSMDGDQNHFTAANVGANVSTTAGIGVGKLTSPAVTVTPSGILNGTTRYDYKVVLRDYNGALSAASPRGSTTVGAGTLGTNSVNISTIARTAGIVTVTTATTHNFQSGSTVTLTSTGSQNYDGQHQIASTPSGTTFTYSAFGTANDPAPPSTGTATVIAKNTVRWNMHQDKTLQSFIYRSVSSGAYSLIGIVEGMDGAFVDWNLQAAPISSPLATQAAYISTGTPTAVALNGILATRITGISGTTITIAANAVTTATSQPAAHDNSPVVIAGCAAIQGASGNGILYIPNTGSVAFNSVLNLRDNCHFSDVVDKLRIQSAGATIQANEPIVLRHVQNYLECVGGGGQLMSFSTGISCEIAGNAYPLVYVPRGNGPTTLKNFLMTCPRAYQSCVVEDQDSGNGGTVNTDYDNVSFNGSSGSMPFIARGGAFFHRWRRGVFGTGGLFGIPESLQITIPNALGLGPALTLGGNMIFDQVSFIGKGVLYETWGINGQSAGSAIYNDTLYESGTGPLIRFSVSGSAQGFDIIDPSFNDAVLGSTPVIELGTNATGYNAFRVFNPQCNGDPQPLFAGGGGGIELFGSSCSSIGASQYKQDTYGGTGTTLYANSGVGVNGGLGYFFTQMANPAPVVSLVQSVGGNIANGTHYYSIVAVDANNHATQPSSQIGITTTGANKTVTITPPMLPAGAIGYRIYRNDGSPNNTGVLDVCGQLTTPVTGAFADTIAAPCGNPAPTYNVAGSALLSPTGYAGVSVTLIPTTFANLGTPVNGTFYFCPDCTVANPCASVGTGALAKRLNGVWVCN